MVKLSVAIPTFNGGESLIRAIRSCSFIDLPSSEFEILVIDNASTDESIAKVSHFHNSFRNFKVIRNDRNVGRIGNWNLCIDHAQGEYILFLFTNEEIHEGNRIAQTLLLMKERNIKLSLAAYCRGGELITRAGGHSSDKFGIIDNMGLCLESINAYSMPFGPLQANIYDRRFLVAQSLRFDTELDLNADQKISFQVALLSAESLICPAPQIVWNMSEHRFHSKVTIEYAIKEDFRLLWSMVLAFNLPVQPVRLTTMLTYRTFSTGWNRNGTLRAYLYILQNKPILSFAVPFYVIGIVFSKAVRRMAKNRKVRASKYLKEMIEVR